MGTKQCATRMGYTQIVTIFDEPDIRHIIQISPKSYYKWHSKERPAHSKIMMPVDTVYYHNGFYHKFIGVIYGPK